MSSAALVNAAWALDGRIISGVPGTGRVARARLSAARTARSMLSVPPVVIVPVAPSGPFSISSAIAITSSPMPARPRVECRAVDQVVAVEERVCIPADLGDVGAGVEGGFEIARAVPRHIAMCVAALPQLPGEFYPLSALARKPTVWKRPWEPPYLLIDTGDTQSRSRYQRVLSSWSSLADAAAPRSSARRAAVAASSTLRPSVAASPVTTTP